MHIDISKRGESYFSLPRCDIPQLIEARVSCAMTLTDQA